ncbi:MAG: hypothetical protein HYV94_16140 [Candidatus Rokubacteria bacterium]|nr:hypothetical protein [Candidatus Rokubacteria bacterium]
MKFRQIEPTAWRKGPEITHLAVIAREPADLAEQWGLQFSAHADELGPCKAALIADSHTLVIPGI